MYVPVMQQRCVVQHHCCCPRRSVCHRLATVGQMPSCLWPRCCCPALPQPLSITLKGITNDSVDPSIDTWRTVALPLLRKAGGLDESSAGGSLELRVVKRGARPAGGGEVQLRVPLVRQLPHVVMTDEGMVKRIRGISYSMKVGRGRLMCTQCNGWPSWLASSWMQDFWLALSIETCGQLHLHVGPVLQWGMEY